MFQQSYLGQAFRSDKLIFSFICLFLLGELFFTWKQVEQFPFLLFGMYSKPEPSQETYPVYSIFVGGEEIQAWQLNDPARELCLSPLQYYHQLSLERKDVIEEVIDKRFQDKLTTVQLQAMKSALVNDSVRLSKFPAWLLANLSDFRVVEKADIEVRVTYCSYSADGRPHPLHTETLFHYFDRRYE